MWSDRNYRCNYRGIVMDKLHQCLFNIWVASHIVMCQGKLDLYTFSWVFQDNVDWVIFFSIFSVDMYNRNSENRSSTSGTHGRRQQQAVCDTDKTTTTTRIFKNDDNNGTFKTYNYYGNCIVFYICVRMNRKMICASIQVSF